MATDSIALERPLELEKRFWPPTQAELGPEKRSGHRLKYLSDLRAFDLAVSFLIP